MERRLGFAVSAEAALAAQVASVPRFLDELSLDGAIRLVEAFGILRVVADPPRAAARAACLQQGRAGLIERGLERLEEIDGSPERVLARAEFIHVPALERLRATGVTQADSKCAALFLRYLRAPASEAADRRGRHGRGQLFLFD